MWLFDGISASLQKIKCHVLASPFYTTVLSWYGESYMERLREHVDIWDKDYGVIINECLCCVSLSLLTLLSDWGLVLQDRAGPHVCALLLHLTTRSGVKPGDPCGLSQKFKIRCQSTKAFSLPQLQCALTLALIVTFLN